MTSELKKKLLRDAILGRLGTWSGNDTEGTSQYYCPISGVHTGLVIMPKTPSYFREEWLKNPKFCTWIEKTTNKKEARCKLCYKVLDLSNMGMRR